MSILGADDGVAPRPFPVAAAREAPVELAHQVLHVLELVAEPPKDSKLVFEKELRIEELTQAIDDLTGNYLSDRMRAADSVR